MLDKINKEILLERLNNFKNQKLVTLDNIQNCLKQLNDFKENTSSFLAHNKIYLNHKKHLNKLEDTIHNLEYLERTFDFFKAQELVFATSNKSKLDEIKRIIPNIKSLAYAKDIEEVDRTIEEVIIYKSKDARSQNHIPIGTSIVVEDTIIRNLDTGKDITDIKWNVNALEEGTNVEWITSLGLNDGINIYIFQGKERGIITTQRGDEGFAFDPYFIPTKLYQEYTKDYTLNGVNYGKLYPNHTLGELDKIGVKDLFSARVTALKDLSEFRLDRVVSLVDIPEWEGRYQNEKEINVNSVDLNEDDFFNNIYYMNRVGLHEKTLKCFNDFKNLLYDLDIDFNYQELKEFVKSNEIIYVSLDPYNRDMFGNKSLIFDNSLEGLEYNVEQSCMDI